MSHKWKDIQHKVTPEQREKARQETEREYNRFYWRIVRLWDRIRGRS